MKKQTMIDFKGGGGTRKQFSCKAFGWFYLSGSANYAWYNRDCSCNDPAKRHWQVPEKSNC